MPETRKERLKRYSEAAKLGRWRKKIARMLRAKMLRKKEDDSRPGT